MAENMRPPQFTRPGWQFLILVCAFITSVAPVRAQDTLVALKAGLSTDIHVPAVPAQPIETRRPRPIKRPIEDRSPRRFLALSIGVYTAAFLDMGETFSLRPRLEERDPLAKPFATMPAPAYFITGAALATGVTWIGLKMARSRRWHRVWWLPQVCSIAGNSSGFVYTKMHEHPR